MRVIDNTDALILLSITMLENEKQLESSVSEIARVSGLSVGSVSNRTRNLEVKGILIRIEDTRNRITHYLTQTGTDLLTEWIKDPKKGLILKEKYSQRIMDKLSSI